MLILGDEPCDPNQPDRRRTTAGELAPAGILEVAENLNSDTMTGVTVTPSSGPCHR
jgi:hypothetical protein